LPLCGNAGVATPAPLHGGVGVFEKNFTKKKLWLKISFGIFLECNRGFRSKKVPKEKS
jgi:hypothetical protein